MAKEPKPKPPGWQESPPVKEPCKRCQHSKHSHEDHVTEHGECAVYWCGCSKYHPA